MKRNVTIVRSHDGGVIFPGQLAYSVWGVSSEDLSKILMCAYGRWSCARGFHEDWLADQSNMNREDLAQACLEILGPDIVYSEPNCVNIH